MYHLVILYIYPLFITCQYTLFVVISAGYVEKT